MPDVLIIGGGPAGSLAAVVLARAGVDVAVVEQHAVARDKVCGECVSAIGCDVLSRNDLLNPVTAAGASRMTRSLVHPRDGQSLELRLNRPMLGITRRAFDGLLLRAAASAGATIVQPARVESLDPGERPMTRVRNLVDNTVTQVAARFVIVADGKGTALGTTRPTGDLGVKAHFVGVDAPTDAVQLFSFAGHYAGLAPVEDGRWNVAMSIPQRRVKAIEGDFDALLAGMFAENIKFATQLRDARRDGPWLASALPRFAVRNHWPQNVIPVGNAAAAIEPIGGEGMGLALRSAELAADAVVASLRKNKDVNVVRLRAAYRRLWIVRRMACRAAAIGVSSHLMNEAAQLVGESRFAQFAAITLIGK